MSKGDLTFGLSCVAATCFALSALGDFAASDWTDGLVTFWAAVLTVYADTLRRSNVRLRETAGTGRDPDRIENTGGRIVRYWFRGAR